MFGLFGDTDECGWRVHFLDDLSIMSTLA
jgi:hypothetical protein